MKLSEDQIPEFIRHGKDREVVPLLYKKVFPLVEKYILKHSGRREDASDVFQDALMVFYKQVIKGTFDQKYKVFGYLYRLSINYWLNKIKKDKKIQLVEEIQDEEIFENFVEERIISKGNGNILQELFADIGEKCIELLTYTIYYNLMVEDIMIRMGVGTEGAVKMQQQRCKQKLIKEIEKRPEVLQRLRGYEK